MPLPVRGSRHTCLLYTRPREQNKCSLAEPRNLFRGRPRRSSASRAATRCASLAYLKFP